MSRVDQIISQRIRKLKELKSQGINPYPYNYKITHKSKEIKKKYDYLKLEQQSRAKVKLAGRVMNLRNLGKISFSSIMDFKGKIQIVLQKDNTPNKSFNFFKKYVDIGDFIGVEGNVLKTKRGEISILVKSLTMLSKSILPLPDKWHGLKDKEERYRRRYIDLIMNPKIKETFKKRERIIDLIREFLKSKGFNEVETPYLQTIYGGANASPFKTHLNTLNIDLYLAISPELYLKRLIVGGYDKVFTIARNFRNEGIDRWHNPEFTMMEIYWAYADYNDMIKLFEDIYVYTAKKLNGTTKIKFRGKEINFKKPWKRMTMTESIIKYAKINPEKMTDLELKEFIKKNNINTKGNSWGKYVESIFENFCESNLEQPTFILDHPLESTPLCKLHRSDKLCRLIERFEPFCMGAELGNAYSELNDPTLQRKLLEEQQELLAKGDEEANPYDEDFINSIEIGMPPTGGLGLGIDRMVMLLTGEESIRDIILFPFMKPLFKKDKKEVN